MMGEFRLSHFLAAMAADKHLATARKGMLAPINRTGVFSFALQEPGEQLFHRACSHWPGAI